MAESIKGIERRTVIIHSNLYPLTLTPEKALHKLENEIYAQNLYAALCNNEFKHVDCPSILPENWYSMSWRAAGRVVSEARNMNEDYLDYYCSGIIENDSYSSVVEEGTITEEIKQDLFRLGWTVCN